MSEVQGVVAIASTMAVWHLYVVHTPKRKALQTHLLAQRRDGDPLLDTVPPRQGTYAPFGFSEPRHIVREVLNLPISPYFTETQQTRVIDAMWVFAF